MSKSVTARLKIRKSFERVPSPAEMPDLIELQKSSYEQFLQKNSTAENRLEEGLQAAFQSVFPIKDFAGKAQLEFYRYDFDLPKYDVDECMQRGLTYSAPLRVIFRLVVWDVDEDTGARSIRDIKEQEVYVGDMPLMTDNGTFIVNGVERVIVSQMHRSPGVFFDHDRGKTHSSGKFLFSARVIPYRGSWLDFEFDSKDILNVRIDRRRKLPVTTLLMALDSAETAEKRKKAGVGATTPHQELDFEVLGMSREEILNTFYTSSTYATHKSGWKTEFDAESVRSTKLIRDIVDAKTGKVIVEAGTKVTPRKARQLVEAGLKEILVPVDDLMGRFLAEDYINKATGEVIAESGDELTEELLEKLLASGEESLKVLSIDYVRVGPHLRNTLAADRNLTREDALMDVYRVLRPGEPPTVESAEALFFSLFFDSERFDLSAVGRVKMNSRLDMDVEDSVRVLRREDVIEIVRTLLELKDGRGQVDDIDNLANRRVRSVGELLENSYRVGLLRMERAVRERMSSVDIETVMPNDLINAKPAAAAVKEFFGSSQLSQFMDQTNPLSEVTHKRRLSALGPGGLTRDRAGFEVRDVHPTHYGRICPIETPEGQNIGLINSLATYARVNKYGFIETPYRHVKDSNVTNDVTYLSAMEEWRHTVAQATSKLTSKNKFADEFVVARRAGEVMMVPANDVDYMDVSPKQLVSVAASLIPFLENDDANRALMGSNMQRQAVPLLQNEAPLVGTGMERTVARDSGVVLLAKRRGVVDQVDGTRIVIRAEGDAEGKGSGVDIYKLRKFQRSNQSTCLNQRPLVRPGDIIEKGDPIADGPSTDDGELALGRNPLAAFLSWNGYNFEDSIVISERIVKDDVFTSIHIEEFEMAARDTKLGYEELTRDIPNVSDEALRNLDEAGIVAIGAEVKTGDILVGKITPKG
ncbi:MAG: DNA-directed RNA polymerase subunit beta, partial [bacterium]|nr:DNA-directed RNA polymerase subunit beta [bacterium]